MKRECGLNFTEQMFALADSEKMELAFPMLHNFTVQSSLPEAKSVGSWGL